MVLKTCQVKFSNPCAVFFGGDVVSGTVNITLTKQKRLLDLTFQAKGETSCRWSVRRGSGKNSHSVTFTSLDVHFRVNASLLSGYPRDESVVVLEPGDHSFGFWFQIPQGVPTSMEGRFGRVRYTLKVTASRRMRFDDVFKLMMSVIGKYDLNLNPRCTIPMKLELSKTFNFLFASRGHADIRVRLPMTGFVPGQIIQMICEMKNNSQVKINSVHFALMQKKTFTCTHPHIAYREEHNKIASLHCDGVDEGAEITYPVNIIIPSLPPSTSQPGLITTEYTMRVKVVVSGLHRNIEGETLIIMGTSPVRFDQGNYNNTNAMLPSTSSQSPRFVMLSPRQEPRYIMPSPRQEPRYVMPSPRQEPRSIMPSPSAPPSEPSYFGNPPPYHELAPPTYEESRTSSMMAHTDPNKKDVHFSPVYPVYNFPPVANQNTDDDNGFNIPKD